MTKNEILKKIGIILIELREQYDLTQLNRDDINDIELELFAANAHFLADHIEILRKLNSREAKPLRQEAPPEPKFFEPVVKTATPEKPQPQLDFPNEDEMTLSEFDEPVHIEEPIHAEIEQPIIRHEVVLDEPTQPVADEETAEDDMWATEDEMETEFEEEPEVEEEEEPEPVAEYIEEPIEEPVAEEQIEEPAVEVIEPEVIPQPEITRTQVIIEDASDRPLVTINQILSSQNTSTPNHSTLQPITDLKSAITLNDKLLFVRDLFNGYSMAYGEAIEILNRFSRFEEADNFLKLNYYAKNNWEAKQATTDKFYELLQRRFPE